eukprot:TRINITY_DN12228_c0_g1_i1.p1 TRINITY_DN12228_c0_g1~~TRINITY_DN12228_c0_g1_i1.p1  ORF type:complete len:189 (+),score=38.33 TRINITY_DN12228_c0_g1_i1:53-568(+)
MFRRIPEVATPVRGRSSSPRVVSTPSSGKKRGRSGSVTKTGKRRAGDTPVKNRDFDSHSTKTRGSSIMSSNRSVGSTPAMDPSRRPIIVNENRNLQNMYKAQTLLQEQRQLHAQTQEELANEKSTIEFLLNKIRDMETVHNVQKTAWAEERIQLQEYITTLKYENKSLRLQ